MRPESFCSQSERQRKEMQEFRRLWDESERLLHQWPLHEELPVDT